MGIWRVVSYAPGRPDSPLPALVRHAPSTPPPNFTENEVTPHAGIAGKKCADAIAKHQAIQDDDTPVDTTFLCANLEGNPFCDTTWFTFEEAARTHACTLKRPNSPFPKLLHESLG
eukprot:146297-Pelagomonas_calceolata.AAC.1